MKINIGMLLIWWFFALIISIIGAVIFKDSMSQFISRFSFTEYFDTVVFLILTHFKLISDQ